MKVSELIKNIKSKNILVIGDIMLDKYYFGKSTRISPEAPVPILLEKDTKNILGGASNVALNLSAAGQNVALLSIIGNDSAGKDLKKILKENNINTNMILTDDNRCTIVKNRFIGQNNMQMFRFDRENIIPLSNSISKKIFSLYEKEIDNYDLVIISDYNKGLLNVENTPKFIEIANKHKKKVLVDIKEPFYKKYMNAYILKPNMNELEMITGMKCNDIDDVISASRVLKENTNCTYVLATLGKDGMMLVGEDSAKKIECASKEVYDVTGAGDTVISYLGVSIANNYDVIDSVNISNYAAGVKVSKMGTYAVKKEDILDYIVDSNNILDEEKIVKLDKLVDVLSKKKDKKIVFTNGCFDIFHVGHLRCLREAAKYGDILIVGLNSDASVKRLKGKNRPIVSENERAELIAALSFVSYVVLFDEDTPYEIIKKIKPNIITKGGDYKPEDVVGKDIVEENGGEVIIYPLVENKSTTNIINKILEVYHE